MIARSPRAARRRTPLTRPAASRRAVSPYQPPEEVLSLEDVREALRIAAALIFPAPRNRGKRMLRIHEAE